MTSQNISGLARPDFPSGSNWGVKEVEAVRFNPEPDEQDFKTFDCGGPLSDENARVLTRLSGVFSVPVGRFRDKEYIDSYEEHRAFYDQLAAVLRPKPMPGTPTKSLTRSEVRYNTSSPFTESGQPKSPTAVPPDFGSPDSSPAAGVSKRKVRVQNTTPPPRKAGRLFPAGVEGLLPEPLPGYMAGEASPGPPDGEQRVTREQPLSTLHPSSGPFNSAFDNTSSTSNPEPGASSSQSSSFQGLSSPTLPLEPGPGSDADVLEDEVVELFLRFFDSICAVHGDRDGIKFTPDYGKDLVVVIDGEIVHTRPDLTVSVVFTGQDLRIPLFDYEVRPYFQLCLIIITVAGQTIVRKAKVCAKGQRNAWPLFQSKGPS